MFDVSTGWSAVIIVFLLTFMVGMLAVVWKILMETGIGAVLFLALIVFVIGGFVGGYIINH